MRYRIYNLFPPRFSTPYRPRFQPRFQPLSNPTANPYPQVLLLDVETELQPRLEFLLEIGMREMDVPNVVQSFPLLLGLDVETRMMPVVHYLLDLGESKWVSNE